MNERQRVKVLEQLSAFLDGQLDETEQRQIESHLANEPELQEMYEGLHNTKLLFSRLHRVHAPTILRSDPRDGQGPQTKTALFLHCALGHLTRSDLAGGDVRRGIHSGRCFQHPIR